jgi:hypothetical protein
VRKLLAGLCVLGILWVAAPAEALEVYTQNSLTKANPIVEDLTAVDPGVSVVAYWERENTTVVHLDVTGPQECHMTVPADAWDVACYMPEAPAGDYSVTVSVDTGKVHQVTLQLYG